MNDLPDDLKWYPLYEGQWLVVECPLHVDSEQVKALLDAFPASLRERVLIVVGKAFVLDPTPTERT